ncbi:DUF6248 family natural product biosynthesis protein [Streptomyces humi]
MPTTWLRYVGASIMGILDPVPSAVASPMPEEQGAWVRANAWTKGLRQIDDAYPHGFLRWCSCEAGTCHPCRTGQHGRCVSVHGPRVNEQAGTITDRNGFVAALILYGQGQRPCRWVCPCTHTVDAAVEESAAAGASDAQPTAPGPRAGCSAGVAESERPVQPVLFDTAWLSDEPSNSEAS